MSWEANVRTVTPYTPGEQPKRTDIIKLNTNENPYPPSPKVAECLAHMDPASLRRYPQVSCDMLREALAARYGLKKEQVFAGVGSDDVLAMCFLTFFYGEKPVLFPDITYSFYNVWAELYRIPYREIPLDENLKIRTEDYFAPNGGIVIANPNAPTGELLPLAAIEKIVSGNPDSVVIADEAYIDFGGESALPLISRYDNLLVVQTFSKSRSLAGMRIGYAFGNEKLIGFLDSVKYAVNSYTLSTPALLAGCAALEDEAYFLTARSRIMRTRERMKGVLKGLGFQMGDSMTNFLFVTHPEADAEALLKALKAEGIYVRHFKQPRISNYLRITVGTDEEMDALTDSLRRYLGK